MYKKICEVTNKDNHLRRTTYFLCEHEGEWYFPRNLKQEMSLDIDDQKLRDELELIYKYDIVEKHRGRYGGVFDRSLKKVLMTNSIDILGLPVNNFNAYFRSDSLLDYQDYNKYGG